MLRADLRLISEIIPPGRSVLDLGCGDGALLAELTTRRGVKGRGIELLEEAVLACVERGLSVRQGSLEEGLADYPAGAFDYVILSQTLPFVDHPELIIGEMLRVGKTAIISFPNWGHWRSRFDLLFSGRIPLARDLPQRWFDVPRWQALTVVDFCQFCHSHQIRIREQLFLSGERRLRWTGAMNWRATTAIFTLGGNGASPTPG